MGIPEVLVTDGAKEEYYGEWGQIVKERLIYQRITEPHSGWQNRCEGEIREFKKHHRQVMGLNKCPEVFWDFACLYTLDIRKFLIRATTQRNNHWRIRRYFGVYGFRLL